jgi:hypothetical protein
LDPEGVAQIAADRPKYIEAYMEVADQVSSGTRGSATRWHPRGRSRDEDSAAVVLGETIQGYGGRPGLVGAERLAGERLEVLGETVAHEPLQPTCLFPSARSISPARTKDQHNSQSATGHTGPRQ